ncbi:class I SAM-dependent methyltransferase [Nocardiopsis sp. CNT312]|uniref:class I SAM-dependent methyltransferase n=1 Tax=Nocardiopsis sp. CNT312 TaxID=1137268 RepID=UPI000491635E|nr:class I SAM-dependent methyltransferase [Nocardiopsis sp. CNT312]
MDPLTERARRTWNRRAALDALSGMFEPPALRRTREILCSGARGETLEVAVGSGRNLRHYPPQARLTGLDLNPEMLARARETARGLGALVRLVEGDAQAMEFPDKTFDTVVCVMGLSVVADRHSAMAEMYRVLVPGGRLLFVDHITHSRLPSEERRRERARTLHRDSATAVGFDVGHHDHLGFGTVERMVATRPD